MKYIPEEKTQSGEEGDTATEAESKACKICL